jgi:hypothetical protein
MPVQIACVRMQQSYNHQLISYIPNMQSSVTMTGEKSYVDQVSVDIKRASTKQA